MIYADNAATTKMSRAAIAAMQACMEEVYGNPSSLYTLGQEAKETLEKARAEIAAVIGADPEEILFTSGGSEVGNAKCGDIMKMYLKIENDTVADVKFETFGCGSAIASSSMATELIKGRPVSEAAALTNKAVAEALDGLPAYKMHCSVLAEEAIRAALDDYYQKNPEKKPQE